MSQITVEERLNAIGSVEPSSSMETDTDGSLSTPKTDSLATLLTQGLLSNDKKILNVSITCAVCVNESTSSSISIVLNEYE